MVHFYVTFRRIRNFLRRSRNIFMSTTSIHVHECVCVCTYLRNIHIYIHTYIYIFHVIRHGGGARPRYELISNSSSFPLSSSYLSGARHSSVSEKNLIFFALRAPPRVTISHDPARAPASPANICLRKFRKVYTRAPEPAAFRAGVFLQVNFLSPPHPRPYPPSWTSENRPP